MSSLWDVTKTGLKEIYSNKMCMLELKHAQAEKKQEDLTVIYVKMKYKWIIEIIRNRYKNV